MNGLCLGEKIETIINTRVDDRLGKYLGSSGKTFGACRIDGVVYKVERNIETDNDDPYWTIHNINDRTTAVAHDQYDIACIKEADFK